MLYCAVGMPPLMAGKKSFRKALKGERKKKVEIGGGTAQMDKFYFTVYLMLHP